jgi:hypothetical protein
LALHGTRKEGFSNVAKTTNGYRSGDRSSHRRDSKHRTGAEWRRRRRCRGKWWRQQWNERRNEWLLTVGHSRNVNTRNIDNRHRSEFAINARIDWPDSTVRLDRGQQHKFNKHIGKSGQWQSFKQQSNGEHKSDNQSVGQHINERHHVVRLLISDQTAVERSAQFARIVFLRQRLPRRPIWRPLVCYPE